MAEFKLGDRVRYTNALHRRYKPSSPMSRRVWEPYEFDVQHPEHRGEGIVVGMRTLADGRVQSGYPDDPPAFFADERFPAVLIAHSLRSKPVFVRVEDVQLIGDPTSPDSGSDQ